MPNHPNTNSVVGIKANDLPVMLDNPQHQPISPLAKNLAAAANDPGEFTVGSQAGCLATAADKQKSGLVDMPVEIILKIISHLDLRTSAKVLGVLVESKRSDLQPELQSTESWLDCISAIKTFGDLIRVAEQLLTEPNKLRSNELYQLITPKLNIVKTIADFENVLKFKAGISYESARPVMFELLSGRFFQIKHLITERMRNFPVSSRLLVGNSPSRQDYVSLQRENLHLALKFGSTVRHFSDVYPELESLLQNMKSPHTFCLWLKEKVAQDQSCWKTALRYGIDSQHPLRFELERAVLVTAGKEAGDGKNCNQIASRYGIVTTEGRIELEKGSAAFYAEMLNTLLPSLNFQEKVYCYKQEFGLEIKQPRPHLNPCKDLSDLKEVQARLGIITKAGIDEIGEVKKKHEIFMGLPPVVLAKHIGSKSSR